MNVVSAGDVMCVWGCAMPAGTVGISGERFEGAATKCLRFPNLGLLVVAIARRIMTSC